MQEHLNLIRMFSRQVSSTPPSATSNKASRIYHPTKPQLHLICNSSWIPAFGQEDAGLHGSYLSTLEEVKDFDFPSYKFLQEAIQHNGRFDGDCKRHYKQNEDPTPLNWAFVINNLCPGANITFRTAKKSTMAKWLTLVPQKSGIRLVTAAKLMVIHDVHNAMDNLLEFSEETAQDLLEKLNTAAATRKRKHEEEDST